MSLMNVSIHLPNTIDKIRQTNIRDYLLYSASKGSKIDFVAMKTNTGISMDEYKKFIMMNPSIEASKIGLID